MQSSEIITEFVKLIEAAQNNNEIYKEKICEEDKVTQDLLHKLELENMSYNERTKVATLLRNSRRIRRVYKDFFEITNELFDWANDPLNKKSYELLKQTLGRIRKIEAYHKERHYNIKSLKMKNLEENPIYK